MNPPVQSGAALLCEIETETAESPVIWWLGHCGFVLKYLGAVVYIDPLLSSAMPGRLTPPPLSPHSITHAGLILCTHGDPHHFDPETVSGILASSPRAKLVVPKAFGEGAHRAGIDYRRMVTTNADLRVEFRDDRIYAVPSAQPALDWTAIGGYPYLGYLVRFGACTIYHAGDSVLYDGLAERLRPYNVTVATLPIGGPPVNFEVHEAATLAEEIGAEWLIPMHYGVFSENRSAITRFIAHMLGHRPAQKFKVFECGEKWRVP